MLLYVCHCVACCLPVCPCEDVLICTLVDDLSYMFVRMRIRV